MDEPARPIIRAFVGRTFNNAQDKALWIEIREVLDNLRGVRFSWEDAEEPQMLSVSSKIRQKIADNHIYVGILTRRKPIFGGLRPSLLAQLFAGKSATQGDLWSVSPWVVQESGYALGLGKKVLFLLEEGVDFPMSDMQADAEWIPFVRSDLKSLQMRLITILINEIGKNLPLLQEGISSEREQVVPAPPNEQAEQNTETNITLTDVRTRLNAKDFNGADELFQQFAKIMPEDLQSWLKYYYLRLKAASGHQDSLDRLYETAEHETSDLEARTQLALYFQNFNEHAKAIEVLRGGLSVIEPELRPALYRLIAQALVKDNNYESAIETLATLLQANKLSTLELKLTFLTLADIAQQHEDKILESSALERALELEPADAERRFRLAFLYSSTGQYALAAYHYKIRLAQDDNSTVKNNLAVAFGNLNLRGREVDLYLAASGEESLAKANLSHSYVDGGFLKEAERQAREALEKANDTTMARASSALARIRDMREAETKRLAQLSNDGKTEAQFRSRFAEAFLSDTPQISGSFKTKYGVLTFEQMAGRIVGTKKEELPPSVFANLLALPTASSGSPTIRWTTLEASVIGRSARFTVRTREAPEGLLSSMSPSIVEGLLILAPDGTSFEVLEDGQNPAVIHLATRVGLAQIGGL